MTNEINCIDVVTERLLFLYFRCWSINSRMPNRSSCSSNVAYRYGISANVKCCSFLIYCKQHVKHFITVDYITFL